MSALHPDEEDSLLIGLVTSSLRRNCKGSELVFEGVGALLGEGSDIR